MNEKFVISIEDRNTKKDKLFLISKDTPFKKYSFYKVLDEENENPICKVENSYANRNLKDLDNKSLLNAALSRGFKLDEGFYYANIEIEKELLNSISPMATAINATEEEMYKYLYKGNKDNLILGEIRGTNDNYINLKQDTYKDKLMMSDGYNLKKQENLPLLFDYKGLQQNPNIGIFGNSGSGKTYALKSLVEEMIQKEIPLILFDPHNEFDFTNHMPNLPKDLKYDYADKIETFEAGKDFGIRFTDLSNENLKTFLRNVSTLSDPQEMALDELRTTRTDTFESFREKVEKVALALMKKDGKDACSAMEQSYINRYGGKIASPTVLTALNGKLSAFSKKGFFRKDYDNIEQALKNKKTVVIRGEYDIVSPMMGHIVQSLWRKRKEYKDGISKEKYPPMMIVLDEAHIFAPKFQTDIKTPLKKPLQDISREGRKYGIFLTCATQRVSELDTTILSQMSTKIILKTAQESDKQIIKKECGLSEIENNRLHLLNSGNGYIISPILKTKKAIAFKARGNYTMPKITENVFDELEKIKPTATKDNLKEFILESLPLKMSDFSRLISEFSKKTGNIKNIADIEKIMKELEKEEKILISGMGFKREYSIMVEEDEQPFS